jgi:hypothetical protein
VTFGFPLREQTSGPVAKAPSEMSRREVITELATIREQIAALESAQPAQKAELDRRLRLVDEAVDHREELVRNAHVAVGPNGAAARVLGCGLDGDSEQREYQRREWQVSDAAQHAEEQKQHMRRAVDILGALHVRVVQLETMLMER